MKKLSLLLAALMIALSITGCIKIVIGPGESTEVSAPVQTEAPTDQESESETEDVIDPFDPTGFIGTWAAAEETAPRMIFRDDFSCLYLELDAKTEERICGYRGTGIAFNEDGESGFELIFEDFNELDGAKIVLDGDALVLKKDGLERRFAKSDKDEATVLYIADEKVDILNGILRELDVDGTYHSSQVMSAEDGNEFDGAWFTQARIEDGFLIIAGNVGKYDAAWNETIYGANAAKLLLAEDCRIYAQGGTNPDEEITAESFNESFYETFTGLGLAFDVKNGVVTAVYRQS